MEHGTPLIPDGLTLRKAFGRPMVRKLRGDGVLFAGLSYSCEALREAYLHSPTREVEIRADLSDIGWVAVRVGATWYPALANQSGFDGITFEQLHEGRRSIRHKHKRDALLDAPKVQRAIQRISETNRRAFALRELTPFHMTDIDVARSEAALHYPIRSDSMRLGHIKPSDDPLSNGISITAPIGKGKLDAPSNDTTNPPERREKRERRKHWRFDDEK